MYVSFSEGGFSPASRVFLMMFFKIFEYLLFLFDLPCIVLSLFIGNFDFEFVVLELFLLSFYLNTKIKKLFFESRLVLFESRLLGLFGDKTFLNLDGCRKYFIDELLTLFS